MLNTKRQTEIVIRTLQEQCAFYLKHVREKIAEKSIEFQYCATVILNCKERVENIKNRLNSVSIDSDDYERLFDEYNNIVNESYEIAEYEEHKYEKLKKELISLMKDEEQCLFNLSKFY